MRRFPVATAALVVGLASTASGAQASDVYKWTDENGVAHYSDAPPEGKQYDRVNVRGQVQEAPAAEEAQETTTETPATTTPSKPTNQTNCEMARKNLNVFQSASAVSMDRDGDGRPELMTDAQRAEEVARNEELVKLYCK